MPGARGRGVTMSYVALENLCKRYEGNGYDAIRNVTFSIEKGEFVILLGPSGCGKSTLLRMVAGLEKITAGELLIDRRRVNEVLPKDRDIAMVFQNYALYPHMTVYQNMALSLKIRKIDKAKIDATVRDIAAMLNLTDFLDTKPGRLSGGQRQRVALGRAIVRRPKVFLFDEPLSNLDARLRARMRREISALHRNINATMLYVTHDQVEAMTMADKVVVLDCGVVQQIGSPKALYESPVNKFVAEFIGSPPINFIDVDVTVDGRHITIRSGKEVCLQLPESLYPGLSACHAQKVCLGIRPEDFVIVATDCAQGFVVSFDYAEYHGAECNVSVSLGEGRSLWLKTRSGRQMEAGTARLMPDLEKLHFFDIDTGQRL